jgi:hypothetical protein
MVAANRGSGGTMKQILLIVLVSAIVSGIVVQAYRLSERPDPSRVLAEAAGVAPAATEAPTLAAAGPALSYTDELVEDVWINAARTAGDDHRALTDAENSICFITKIEIKGIQGPGDANSCAMQIDEFTGFWDLVATVEEGGRSEIRCNARCLVWE